MITPSVDETGPVNSEAPLTAPDALEALATRRGARESLQAPERGSNNLRCSSTAKRSVMPAT